MDRIALALSIALAAGALVGCGDSGHQLPLGRGTGGATVARPLLLDTGGGEALALWGEYEGAFLRVMVRRHTLDAGWDDQAYDISMPEDRVTRIEGIVASVDDAGDGVAVWWGLIDEGQNAARVTMRPYERAGDDWLQPQTLAYGEAVVAADSRDGCAAILLRTDTGTRLRHYRPGAGWTDSMDLPLELEGTSMGYAVACVGNTGAIVFRGRGYFVDACAFDRQNAFQPFGSWDALASLTSNYPTRATALPGQPARALLLWNRMQSSIYTVGTGWGPVTPHPGGSEVAMAADASGRALLVIREGPAGAERLYERVMQPDGTWGTVQEILSGGSVPSHLHVGVDPRGGFDLAGVVPGGGVDWSARSDTTGWSPLTATGFGSSLSDEPPQVVLLPAGRLLGAWIQLDHEGDLGADVLRTGIGGRPLAHFTSTPQPPIVGEPIAFDASTSTSLDPITTYEWDFDGDGAFEESGAQPATAHTFGSTGSYPVTLRVTDDRGQQDTFAVQLDVVDPVATLTVTIIGTGTGRVENLPGAPAFACDSAAGSCSMTFPVGTQLGLLASPDAGSIFGAYVSGHVPGDTDGPVTVLTLNADTEIVVRFDVP